MKTYTTLERALLFQRVWQFPFVPSPVHYSICGTTPSVRRIASPNLPLCKRGSSRRVSFQARSLR